MVVIKVEGGSVPSPRANEDKEGDYYDTCPVHGGKEVEAAHQSGGVDNHGHEYRDFAIYSSDLRDGGCGDTWSRTTAQGRQRDNALGREPMQLTRGATRTYSVPSDRFRDNYDRIFRRGG
jgi:hypothetical protein